MEKIQSAIAKARAARDGAPPLRTPPRARAGTVAGVEALPDAAADPAILARTEHEIGTGAETEAAGDARGVAEAWAALPEFRASSRHLAKNRIVTLDGGTGAPEFDAMRTRLMYQLKAKNWRRVAITSPGPGCGKSTVAANLGFSLGRQHDLKTLVIELDLRRPSLARLLGFEPKGNLSEVLKGEAPFVDCAVRHGRGLAFAANRAAARAPAELLGSARSAEALAEIEAAYAPDVVLFDMSPMMVNDDALAFMGQADCALLVAAAEMTTIKEIDACERQLAEHTEVLGIALNRCRYIDRADGYGYGDYG